MMPLGTDTPGLTMEWNRQKSNVGQVAYVNILQEMLRSTWAPTIPEKVATSEVDEEAKCRHQGPDSLITNTRNRQMWKETG